VKATSKRPCSSIGAVSSLPARSCVKRSRPVPGKGSPKAFSTRPLQRGDPRGQRGGVVVGAVVDDQRPVDVAEHSLDHLAHGRALVVGREQRQHVAACRRGAAAGAERVVDVDAEDHPAGPEAPQHTERRNSCHERFVTLALGGKPVAPRDTLIT